jgi:anti-sigma regulatory factor (Ser/Thr protein kinase)
MVDDSVAVAAHAVDELVLLLAEVMDNAARFSRHTRVVVDAHHLNDQVLIQITDPRYRGRSASRRRQINERLVAPPQWTWVQRRRWACPWSGRSRATYSLLVELRPNEPAGTVAEITLPAAVLRTPAPTPGPGPRTAADPPTHGVQATPGGLSRPPSRGRRGAATQPAVVAVVVAR